MVSQPKANGLTHILPNSKTKQIHRQQLMVTLHNVRGGWSRKDVSVEERHTFVWQGHLLSLTEDKGCSLKLDGNQEPKFSHTLASDKMNLLNNERSWDLWIMTRRVPQRTSGSRFQPNPLTHKAFSAGVTPLHSCHLTGSEGSFSDELCSTQDFQITVSWSWCQEDKTVEEIFGQPWERNTPPLFPLTNFSCISQRKVQWMQQKTHVPGSQV